MLKPGSVSSFALVLHELATNSAKYGALSCPDGQLAMTLAEREDEVVVEWLEQGVSTTALGNSAGGFGSKLLTAIIEGHFRGSFERDLRPEGIRIVLHIPRVAFREQGGPE
ncbi:hypothetical protein M3484_23190 [Pseudomonas sp. GX19020]|uniref:hypothetical protein n=1 Tax=Pseudomonas sp. GX19020 TaxID=2942277 RepID=UPI0020196D8D|nr:hypothetical protein [Pseudomonas sp. GX19020]MCL4069466.1 hypothetical protein [Pseudomonas sp. GX19020]